MEKFQALHGDFGPLIFLKLGSINQLRIQDLEIGSACLTSDYWVDRPFDELVGFRSFGKALGIIFNSGQSWKEIRRFTHRNLRDFGFGKSKSMESVIGEEIDLLLPRLDTYATSGEGLAMNQFFTVSIFNILWIMVAGVKFDHDDAKLKKLIQLLEETSRIAPSETSLVQLFPILWNVVKWTPTMKSRNLFHNRMHAFFRELIEERRQSGDSHETPKDFIDVFLKKIDSQQNSKPETEYYYNEEQLIITLYDLFLAGGETTSKTLEFGILNMAQNPEIQDGVREEIHRVVGKSRRPNAEDRLQMPFTEATVLEIQRMASTVPIVLRCASENTTLAGYNVPKGTIAGVNLYAIHRSKKTWGDPEKFRPSRFLDGSQLINTNKIMPFGLGKRICLGEVLANASFFSYFTTILQRYKITLCDIAPGPDIRVNGFLLSPKEYSVRLEKI